MAGQPWDSKGDARRALHGIVSDPQYGPAALSQPTVMANLLKDLIPDQPREAGLLVAAAQADLAGSLRGYVTQGLDSQTATRLTAASFASSTSHTPEACTWVVSELASALGMESPSAASTAQATAPHQAQPAWLAPGGPYQGAPQPQQGYQVPGQASMPGQAQPMWQPPAWTPQAQQKPASPGGPASVLAGICGLAGALLILVGCVVPYYHYANDPAVSIFGGYPNSPVSAIIWNAAEPVGVLLTSIVICTTLLARRRVGVTLPGMLLAFGIQTTLLFAGYTGAIYPPATRYAGGAIGLLGGVALIVAGAVGLGAARKAQADATTAQAPAGFGSGAR